MASTWIWTVTYDIFFSLSTPLIRIYFQIRLAFKTKKVGLLFNFSEEGWRCNCRKVHFVWFVISVLSERKVWLNGITKKYKSPIFCKLSLKIEKFIFLLTALQKHYFIGLKENSVFLRCTGIMLFNESFVYLIFIIYHC